MTGPSARARGLETAGRAVSTFGLALTLAACAANRPAVPLSDTPNGPPGSTPAVASTQLPGLSDPTLTATPPVDVIPTHPNLTVCLTDEPQSLYRYALPEPNGNVAREHILAALEDGPIDHVNDAYRPAILDKLPNLADGDARVDTVTVQAGDRVMDDLGRVVTLTAGVTLNLLDGASVTYAGAGEIGLPQISARFRLKAGLRWNDGAPLTAADSVFGFEIASSPDSFNPRRDLVERTAVYRALDDRTVEWVGLPGDIDPGYFTNVWPPLPRHRYTGLTAAEIAAGDEANFAPLSYGPFMLQEWVHGEQLALVRNPDYFRAAEGLPRLERVIYRFVPDPATLSDALASGRCDVAPRNPSWSQLDAVPAADVRWAEGAALYYLFFGISPEPGYERAAGADFFQPLAARQAVAYCLDRAAFTPPPSAVQRHGAIPAHPIYPAELAELPFDPTRGRALLEAMGWSDSDGDRVLDQGGVSLTLTLAGGPAGEPEVEALLASLQAQLKTNCGVEAVVRPLTVGELTADWPEGVVFGRRFDLAVFGVNIAGAAPPCALWMSNQVPGGPNPGGANAAGYSNPEFDDACRRALTTLDSAAAARWGAEAQHLLARDLPALPLFYRLRLAAARPEVKGVTLDFTSPSELWDIEEVTVAP